MTVVAIHQPNYLPWIGYVSKIMDSDVFILLDNVQYSKNSYTNRVQVKGPEGAMWLTQPVATAGRLGQQICEVEFARPDWGAMHLKTLGLTYARAPYFRQYFEQLGGLLAEPDPRLAECNTQLIRWLCGALGLSTTFVRASELAIDAAEPTRRLIRLTQAVGGDTYLSGAGGFSYQDVSEFEAAGIRVIRSRWVFPQYPQLWGPFVPGLSAVDLLFNCGPESWRYLDQGERRG